MMMKKETLLAGVLLVLAGPAFAAPASPAAPAEGRSYTLVSDAQDAVRGTAGSPVHSSSGACVRTKWMSDDDVCAPAEVPVTHIAAPAPPPPPPPPQAVKVSREERTVYFAFNQASLSPEMKERLDTLAVKLKSEKNVKGAHIVGYADRIGDANYNEKLSKKRAEQVRQYLIAKGIINTSVADTRWEGSSSPTTDCGKKLKRPKLIECLQGDRRVEVEIDYYQQPVSQ